MTKTQRLLKREPLRAASAEETGPDLLDQGREQLLTEAADTLRYKHGIQTHQKILEQIWKTAAVPAALAAVGCQPFTAQSVKAYKKRTTRWNRLAESMEEDDGAFDWFAVLLFIVGFFSLLICSVMSFCAVFSANVADASAHWRIAGISGICFAWTTVLFTTGRILYTCLKSARWELRLLESYQQPIPDFAIQTAVALKKQLPEARFLIEECIKRKIMKDPFLIMEIGDDTYYLEVWDEPHFKAERTV